MTRSVRINKILLWCTINCHRYRDHFSLMTFGTVLLHLHRHEITALLGQLTAETLYQYVVSEVPLLITNLSHINNRDTRQSLSPACLFSTGGNHACILKVSNHHILAHPRMIKQKEMKVNQYIHYPHPILQHYFFKELIGDSKD